MNIDHNKLVDLFTFIKKSENYEEIMLYCLENDLMEFLKNYQEFIIKIIEEIKTPY